MGGAIMAEFDTLGLVDLSCQTHHRRGLEQRAQGQINVERAADSGDDLCGHEGMAAEVEEVVGGGDAVAAEDFGPDGGDGLFGCSGGGDVGLGVCLSLFEGGQGCAVDFAIGRERDLGQQHDGCGDHVVGEMLFEVRAKGVGRGGLFLSCHDIRDQALVTVLVFLG